MRHLQPFISMSTAVLAAGVLQIASGVAIAQNAPTNTPASAPAAAPVPDYHPSLGDLMTMAVQPRHTKLGLAGQQGNWPYAQYELSELRNAFARVGRTIPIYRNIDMAAIIGALTAQPLSAVEQAIHAQDARKFKSAYADLTTACNACHLSQDHAPVVIRVPDTNPYSDQDFRRPLP